jgi:ribonuclease T2
MKSFAGPLLAALLSFSATAAPAQDRAGDFDFYVLALSWSPSYCAAEGREADPAQCRADAPRGFTVHGLWPQREQGYPESCESSEPGRVPSSLADTVADIMPSRGLVGHQWRKHGTCTGLTQAEYLDLVRRARERVAIPAMFENPANDQQLSARDVEQAFVATNPGMSARGIAVSCQARRVAEVRICMTRGLEFRRCGEVDEGGCDSRRLSMPAS